MNKCILYASLLGLYASTISTATSVESLEQEITYGLQVDINHADISDISDCIQVYHQAIGAPKNYTYQAMSKITAELQKNERLNPYIVSISNNTNYSYSFDPDNSSVRLYNPTRLVPTSYKSAVGWGVGTGLLGSIAAGAATGIAALGSWVSAGIIGGVTGYYVRKGNIERAECAAPWMLTKHTRIEPGQNAEFILFAQRTGKLYDAQNFRLAFKAKPTHYRVVKMSARQIA
ncbi:hypothetical protein KG892_03975 [Vermiphilus pyriformis]|nr:MAG: hypothetical protein KG892_03975 [Vermiphilus pyriformis]